MRVPSLRGGSVGLSSLLAVVLAGGPAWTAPPCPRPAVMSIAQCQPVSALAFSPDGTVLASGSLSDPTVAVWEVATGKEVGRFAGHHGGVSALAFSPDGKTLAAGTGAGPIALHDFPGSRWSQQLAGHPSGRAQGLGFSPDGTALASSNHRETRLWQVRDGRWQPGAAETVERSRGTMGAGGPSFSPDGRRLFPGPGRKGMDRFDRKTRTQGVMWKGLEFEAFAALPGAECYASVVREEQAKERVVTWVILWDPRTEEVLRRVKLTESGSGESLRRLKRGESGLGEITFSPDGRLLASVERDGVVRLWDLLAGQQFLQFPSHEPQTRAVFSPNSRLIASGSLNGTIQLWDLGGVCVQTAAGDGKDPWADLQGADALKSIRAQWRLVADPATTVAELRRRLRDSLNRKRVARLLEDLDSRSYAVRARATAELNRMAPAVGVLLLPELEKPPRSLEHRRRLESVLRECDRLERLPANAWRLRAVAILEQIDTAEARAELRRLAKGAPGVLLFREARLALRRLSGGVEGGK
jgi:WD40 repeat protein